MFEIDPESISFQAERLRDSSFYTHIDLGLNNLTVQIDQNFYESGFRYFSQFTNSDMEELADKYDEQFTDQAVSKYLLPRIPKEPKPKLQKTIFFIGFLHVSKIQATLSFSITDFGNTQSNLIYTLLNAFSATLA